MSNHSLEELASEYAQARGITIDLENPLGHGTDGSVWRSSRKSAIKALKLEKTFLTELACYQRFKAARVSSLLGFAVPQLIGYDDRTRVIEMRIVTPPFILDFAKAWLDQPPEFSAETWSDWNQEGEERFEDNWKEVKRLLSTLQRFGIYYYDAKPGNIMFHGTRSSDSE